MQQQSTLSKRFLLVFALGLFASFVCAAQTPAPDGNAPKSATEKAAAPDKDKPSASASAAIDEELSKTPAGKTIAGFFAAFNSGDLKLMRAFHESFGGDTENADKDMEFYEQTGGLKPHSLKRPATDRIAVLVQTKKDARWITFEFTVGAEAPHGINSISVRPTTAPTN